MIFPSKHDQLIVHRMWSKRCICSWRRRPFQGLLYRRWPLSLFMFNLCYNFGYIFLKFIQNWFSIKLLAVITIKCVTKIEDGLDLTRTIHTAEWIKQKLQHGSLYTSNLKWNENMKNHMMNSRYLVMYIIRTAKEQKVLRFLLKQNSYSNFNNIHLCQLCRLAIS